MAIHTHLTNHDLLKVLKIALFIMILVALFPPCRYTLDGYISDSVAANGPVHEKGSIGSQPFYDLPHPQFARGLVYHAYVDWFSLFGRELFVALVVVAVFIVPEFVRRTRNWYDKHEKRKDPSYRLQEENWRHRNVLWQLQQAEQPMKRNPAFRRIQNFTMVVMILYVLFPPWLAVRVDNPAAAEEADNGPLWKVFESDSIVRYELDWLLLAEQEGMVLFIAGMAMMIPDKRVPDDRGKIKNL